MTFLCQCEPLIHRRGTKWWGCVMAGCVGLLREYEGRKEEPFAGNPEGLVLAQHGYEGRKEKSERSSTHVLPQDCNPAVWQHLRH